MAKIDNLNPLSSNQAFSSDASLLSMLHSLREIQLKLGKIPRKINYTGVMSSGQLLRYVSEELQILADAISSSGTSSKIIEQIIEALQGKVDIAQGIENAGKFLGVNEAGNVEPLEVPGISPESVKTLKVMTKLLNQNVFTQRTPKRQWKIIHNLDMYPSCTVVDSAGNTVVGDVDYVSSNELIISFSSEFSGMAYLS